MCAFRNSYNAQFVVEGSLEGVGVGVGNTEMPDPSNAFSNALKISPKVGLAMSFTPLPFDSVPSRVSDALD